MSPGSSPAARYVRYYDVHSADGTRIRAWTNDADGPTILLANELGTNPYAWPALLNPDCGIRVVSWNHRGVGGSQRPADGRCDLDSYLEDAVAVMDDAGLDSAVVAGWSVGVTVAFALADRFPERVDGILAVAGMPGDTFSTMLAPFRVPPIVARHLMGVLSRVGRLGGAALYPLSRNLPWTTGTANLLRHSRLIRPEADADDLRALLQEFCRTDPRWYAHLVLNVLPERRIALSGLRIPVTFLAGRHDLLTGARDVASAARRVPGSRYRELDSSHLIPVEFPDIVSRELLELIERAAGPTG